MSRMGRRFQEVRDSYEQALLDGTINEHLTFSDWLQLERASSKIKEEE